MRSLRLAAGNRREKLGILSARIKDLTHAQKKFSTLHHFILAFFATIV
jgi:hypothetical protein